MNDLKALETLMWLADLDPMADRRPQTVICRSTRQGQGCGHPVDDHVGPGTIQKDCPCCNWSQNEPSAPLKRGPLGLPEGMPVEKWAVMNRAERRAWKRGKQ